MDKTKLKIKIRKIINDYLYQSNQYNIISLNKYNKIYNKKIDKKIAPHIIHYALTYIHNNQNF